MQSLKPRPLTHAEYIVRNDDGQDDQIASARWQLLEAIRRVVPAFLDELRDRVYPEFARLAELNPDFWVNGWKFDTWQLLSDPDGQLTPVLTAWAQRFNVRKENWVFEGALQTLSNWRRFPEERASLEAWGFRQTIAVPGLVSVEDHPFVFSPESWDPTLESFNSWRTRINTRFQEALDAHQGRMRKLVEGLGAFPTVSRFSTDHFEWLALYQCGTLSLDSILSLAPHAGDKTTISKGIHTAASLAAITVRSKIGKLKKR